MATKHHRWFELVSDWALASPRGRVRSFQAEGVETGSLRPYRLALLPSVLKVVGLRVKQVDSSSGELRSRVSQSI